MNRDELADELAPAGKCFAAERPGMCQLSWRLGTNCEGSKHK